MRRREERLKAFKKRKAAKCKNPRRISTSTISICPYVLARFNRMIECLRLGIPIDYGVTPPGRIRLFCFDDTLPFTAYSTDHTLTEWLKLIETTRASIFGPANALRLEACFSTSQRRRWLARKWITHVRHRMMNKRVVGAEDLVTLLPIPAASRVSVYDVKSLRRYDFHTTTIIRTILHSLMINSYGIPSPHEPKNPYTNVPWSYGQMISIVGQIISNLGQRHRFPHYLLRAYRNANYNIKTFLKTAGQDLKISAAREFFGAEDDPVTKEIYGEVIDDIYSEENPPVGWKVVVELVKKRMLSAELMKEWNNLVIAFWLYSNYKIFTNPFWSYKEIDDHYRLLNRRSYIWWRTQPRKILPRVSTAFVMPASAAVVTSAETIQHV